MTAIAVCQFVLQITYQSLRLQAGMMPVHYRVSNNVVAAPRRRAQGYDSGLLDTVKDKVTLYSTSVGDAMPFTTLEAAIGPNQILRESRLGS